MLNLTETLEDRDHQLHLLVDAITDYAIFLLDADGRVATWNSGAQRIKGYTAKQIVGSHFSVFYPAEDVDAGKPERGLSAALEDGRFEDHGWRIRRDGSRFWANVVITPIHDEDGRLRGFAKITRDLTERKRLEDAAELQVRVEEQERIARDLNDEVISSLFRIGLGLQAIADAIDNAGARKKLEESVAELDATIGSLRSHIFKI